jgi:hypothetical protein
MTVGQFVSDVNNSLRGLTKDDRVSGKYIHSVAKDYTSYLMSQRPLMDVMRDTTIFTEVPCVEMIRIKSDKCDIAEFRKCDKIMRSKCQLPEIYNSGMGLVIISVTNMTGDTEYQKLRTAAEYKTQSLRRFQKATKYYYIVNNYLYILGSTNERVTVTALFQDEREALSFSTCSDSGESQCKSAYDFKMVVPDKWRSTIKDQTVEHILRTYKSIPEDENPNLDSNQKSATTQ